MFEEDGDCQQGEAHPSLAESSFLLDSNAVPHVNVVDGVEVEVDDAVQPAFVDGARCPPRSPPKLVFRASIASMVGAVGFPQALRLKVRRSTRASVICFFLHGFLVLLHLIFLALYIPHIEQRLVLPLGTTSSIASTAITIIMQFLITRLALRRNLSLRQTLTATHDLSTSWAGLGSALVTLYRQRVVRSTLLGVICVTLYLGGIAILHVTTSTILSLQSFNGTASMSVATALVMPGFTDDDGGVNMGPESQIHAVDWADASLVARLLPGLVEMTVQGLSGNMVYDVLKDTSGIGNTTVNATTLDVTCSTLTESGAVPNPDGSLQLLVGGAAADPGDPLNVLLVPMYKNSLNAVQFESGQTLSQGPHMLFYTTFPILDSANNVGSSTSDVTVLDTNSTDTFTQYFGCTLSSRQHMVVVDSQTNVVLGGPTSNGAETTPWEEWKPGNLNSRGGTTGDSTVNWWAVAFRESQQSGIETSDYNPLPTHINTYYSYTTLYIAEILGLSQGPVAAVNLSTVPSPLVTHSQLQAVLAKTLWTALHLNACGYAGTDITAEGSARVSIIVAQSRLNINFIPMSRVPRIYTSYELTQPPRHTIRAVLEFVADDGFTAAAVMDNLGVLDVLWLAYRRPDLKASVGHVSNPSGERLRAAGMVKVRTASGTAWRGGSDETGAEEKEVRWRDSDAT